MKTEIEKQDEIKILKRKDKIIDFKRNVFFFLLFDFLIITGAMIFNYGSGKGYSDIYIIIRCTVTLILLCMALRGVMWVCDFLDRNERKQFELREKIKQLEDNI